MTTMLTFPRLYAICKDPLVIMSALEKSPNQIIEVTLEFVKALNLWINDPVITIG